MIPFRQDHYAVLVFEHINCLDKDFIVRFQAAESVSQSVNRKYLEKIEDSCNGFPFKNIGSGQKNRLAFMGKQNGKCIHQCILMIRCKDQRIVWINIFATKYNAVSYTHLTLP